MLKITEYAQRLIDDLDDVDYLDKIKAQQRNWIGRSEGAEVKFKLANHDKELVVYTTRPDTLHGATFMVLSPEHALAQSLATPENADAVAKYIAEAANKSNVDRMQDVIKIRRGAKAAIVNALVKGTGGSIDLIDMSDSKGAGNADSSVSITNSLNLTGKKLNGTLNTFAEPAGNIGTDVSLFTWTGYNFSSL